MTVQQFTKELVARSGYQTAVRTGAGPRPGPAVWRTLGYHLCTVGVFLRAWGVVRLGRWDYGQFTASSVRMLRNAERFGGMIDVGGVEHLAQTPGPVVVVGNHMSGIETSLLPCLVLPYKPAAFVVKSSLLRYPLMGPILKALPVIAVARRNPRDDLRTVLERGTELLHAGISVIVFPQATRSTGMDVPAFNTLGVKLAGRAGVPVVPVALKTDFLGHGRWLKDAGPIDPRQAIQVRFGPPLTVRGTGKAEHQAVVGFITTHLTAWGVPVQGAKP